MARTSFVGIMFLVAASGAIAARPTRNVNIEETQRCSSDVTEDKTVVVSQSENNSVVETESEAAEDESLDGGVYPKSTEGRFPGDYDGSDHFCEVLGGADAIPFDKHFQDGKLFYVDATYGSRGEAQPDAVLALATVLRALDYPEQVPFDVILIIKPGDVNMVRQLVTGTHAQRAQAVGHDHARADAHVMVIQDFFPNFHCYVNNWAQAFKEFEDIIAQGQAAGSSVGSMGYAGWVGLTAGYAKTALWNRRVPSYLNAEFFHQVMVAHYGDDVRKVRILGFLFMAWLRDDIGSLLTGAVIANIKSMLSAYGDAMRFVYKTTKMDNQMVKWVSEIATKYDPERVRFGFPRALFPKWGDQFDRTEYNRILNGWSSQSWMCPPPHCPRGKASPTSDAFVTWFRNLIMHRPSENPRGSNGGAIMAPSHQDLSGDVRAYLTFASNMAKNQKKKVKFLLFTFSSMPRADGFDAQFTQDLTQIFTQDLGVRDPDELYCFLTVGRGSAETMWNDIFGPYPERAWTPGKPETWAANRLWIHFHRPAEPFSVLFGEMKRLFPDSVVVHHGGMGVRSEVAQNGLRSVIVSYGMDQVFGGENIEALGAGLHIQVREFAAGSGPRVLPSVLRLFAENTFKQKAEEAQGKFLEDLVGNSTDVDFDKTKPVAEMVDWITREI